MTALVCLGDSFTEGMCDDTRADGNYFGWADRVAQGLARADLSRFPGPIQYANLAIRGKLLQQVATEQVPAAMSMRPDLVTFHAGPNDVLRPKRDVRQILDDYEAEVERLRSADIEVVLFTGIGRSGGSGLVADMMATRFDLFNSEVRRIAQRQSCILIDNEAVAAFTDRRLWAPDRVHLTAEGHRRVAAHVLSALGVGDPAVLGGETGWWALPLPAEQDRSRVGAVASDAQWVRAHLLPWVGRRLRGVSSGDGRHPKDPELRMVPA